MDSLYGKYAESFQLKMNRFVEEAKNHQNISKAYKIVEEKEESDTDSSEGSDDEDSNSEPSEDNLSESELEECYSNIKNSRSHYYSCVKMDLFSKNKHNVNSHLDHVALSSSDKRFSQN